MSKFCSSCGKENKDNSTFCRNCGKKLSGIHTTTTNDNVKSEINTKILIGVIVVLLVAVAVIGSYAYIAINNNNSESSIKNLNETESQTNNASINNINNNGTAIEEKYIGKNRAIQIAKDFFNEYKIYNAEISSVDFVTINGVPLYRVNYWDNYITYDGTPIGWEEVYIGAKDGKLYDSSGGKVTN